ncbi:MAG: phage tail tube protein [Dyella sp.]|uniref:phage tail tube protein n=1 Tax=Dyella sp. TaxID=1869338 RepID=UPI003F80A3C6
MTLRAKSMLALAIAEVTYGVDPVPTGANAIVTSNAQLSPLEGSTVSRNLDRPTFGADQQLHVGVHAMLQFDVEFVGSGTLGTPPAWGKLMKGCACSETVTATTSVVYAPDTASTESLTLYFFMDGQLHKLTGARGSFQLKVESGQIPHFTFQFWGIWSTPTSTAAPTPTGWSDFKIPTPVTFDNTQQVSLFGLASVFKTFDFDQGNQVTYFDNPGEQEVSITDRQSKGSVSILAPAISDKDYFSTAKANTLGALSFSHGTDDTLRIAFNSTQAQLLQPKYGNDNDRATIEAQLSFVPTNAGDDEWELRLEAA